MDKTFVCGRVGHMAKDCLFKETNEGNVPKKKRKKGKGKGQSKNRVNEVTTPTESATTPPEWELQPVKSRESPRTATHGSVPFHGW